MSYRKITVNDKEYEYTIGEVFTKVKDVGVFKNSEIGDPIVGSHKFYMTPYNVKNAILGIKHHRVVHRCQHGTLTHKTVLDPFEHEIYGEEHQMINCAKCVHEREMDI